MTVEPIRKWDLGPIRELVELLEKDEVDAYVLAYRRTDGNIYYSRNRIRSRLSELVGLCDLLKDRILDEWRHDCNIAPDGKDDGAS